MGTRWRRLMGTKYRLSVKTAALAGVVFLLAGCVQISNWEDTLQHPREGAGCALGGALAGALVGGIRPYFLAAHTGRATALTHSNPANSPTLLTRRGAL